MKKFIEWFLGLFSSEEIVEVMEDVLDKTKPLGLVCKCGSTDLNPQPNGVTYCNACGHKVK